MNLKKSSEILAFFEPFGQKIVWRCFGCVPDRSKIAVCCLHKATARTASKLTATWSSSEKTRTSKTKSTTPPVADEPTGILEPVCSADVLQEVLGKGEMDAILVSDGSVYPAAAELTQADVEQVHYLCADTGPYRLLPFGGSYETMRN